MKEQCTVPCDSEFDAWTEADDKAAIEQVAKSVHVPHVIKNGKFFGRFPSGDVVGLPLRLSTDIATAADEADTPVDQIHALLISVGDKAAADKVMKQGLLEMASFATDYFAALQEIAKASLPE